MVNTVSYRQVRVTWLMSMGLFAGKGRLSVKPKTVFTFMSSPNINIIHWPQVVREVVLPRVFRFLRSWHLHVKQEKPGLVTDHVLHRVVAGIFVPGPDDQPLNADQMMQNVYNEIGECATKPKKSTLDDSVLGTP